MDTGVATEICVVCTPASLWALTVMMLRPSSSVAFVSDMLGGLVEPMLRVLAVAEPLIC
jgi:nicotinamidase-related amidase